ncbi:MAG: hypothetical protein E6Q97_11780 [Desulfurellales bacterium]|nr:MAG: hypothetical protein E6Q97_11780 [Desulfurellales bacterium]
MSNGRLGAVDLAATTNTTVYAGPASGKVGTVTVSLCNRNSTPVRIRLALATSSSPGAAEWVWYDKLIPGNESIERTGIAVDNGKQVVAYSDVANVSVVAYGFEEVSS